jgi:SAM-dependent methyltransferase
MHHLWIGVVSFLLRYWSSDVHHPSSSALVHKTTRKTSGGDQYIHKENGDRQQLMNRLYWPSTLDAFDKFGILQEASRSDSFQVLEIGCGTGSTTYDLAKTLPKAWVIGIDTSEEMIALDKTSLTTYSDDIQRRVTFMVKNASQRNNQSSNSYVLKCRLSASDGPRPPREAPRISAGWRLLIAYSEEDNEQH